MRKIFWTLALLTTYIWVVTGGHEQWIVEKSRKLYHYVASWFNDAEVDFQVQQTSVEIKKKRHRRWD